MNRYSRSQVSDTALSRQLDARIVQDRGTTAELLADLGEFHARKLYLPAGYPLMYHYCVGAFHMSEDVAWKRIRVARAARRFPAIFPAVADGRLHLSGIVLLEPHLTKETAKELLTAAAHKSKRAIERLLAERFPRPDLPTQVRAVSPPPILSPQQVAPPLGDLARVSVLVAPGPVKRETPLPPPRVAPLAPERFALQLTMDREMHDMLRYAQELLGHQVPSGDVTEVLRRALRICIAHLEKRKFAATSRPHRVQRSSKDRRYVTAAVRRAVWKRDEGRCTFVSEGGRRCEARTMLEFDHAEEVARGGDATVASMRLRCRAHNQYTAEQTFGAGFMDEKREAARRASGGGRGSEAPLPSTGQATSPT